MAKRRGTRRRQLIALTALVLAVGLLTASVWTDVDARTRTRKEEATLTAAKSHLASLRHHAFVTRYVNAVTTSKRNVLTATIASLQQQLSAANAALAAANANVTSLQANIGVLNTCLGGVQAAMGVIKNNNNTQAAKDISAVSGPCAQLAGGTSTGLVYPFDFPDPDVILVGGTYYAYATNSVAGNIQIISSTNLTQWTAVGNALPSLPAWANPDNTWAPAVARVGGVFLLYYAAVLKSSGNECISVASSNSPQGPFSDTSTAPLECQQLLGGSIDPSLFFDTGGAPYLVWKSGGEGNTKIWSEQLDPAGTGFVAGATPTVLLTPDQGWQGGTVEAPDLVAADGRYLLFYSGNNWDGANYGIGVASCTGPLGPCTDLSTSPLLSSGSGLAGPGGESVFADTSGSFWIAFHSWIPGAVGSPNSRDLFIRRIDLTQPIPTVGAPAGQSPS